MRLSLTIICAVLAITSPHGMAWAGNLEADALARIVTGMPDHEARFREERRLQLLNEPLFLEGRLKFVAPDRIEKHTTAPSRENLVVDGEWVTVRLFERKNDRRFRIGDDPVLHALFVTLLAILNGEPEKLEALYRVEASGASAAWSIHLVPQQEPLATRVAYVDVSGAENRLLRIEIHEVTGDSMAMTVDYDTGG